MPRLEELRVWIVARTLASSAYRITLEKGVSHHYGLIDQIRRSSISIPSNIADGYGLGTRPQFIKSARMALGCAYGLLTQLYLFEDIQLVDAQAVNRAQELCNRVVPLLLALLKSLGGNQGPAP
jgi:four helix bundle protein